MRNKKETKELKRAEVKNGKICLEGKVVEAKLKGLKIIPYDRQEDTYDGVKKFGDRGNRMSGADVFEIDIFESKPAEANAYILCEEEENSFTCNCYPVLYLKILEEKS